MPSVSEKQRRFMAIQLNMKRRGIETKTNKGMTEQQLRDFARKPGKTKPRKRSPRFSRKKVA